MHGEWLYYTEYISSTLCYYGGKDGIRICRVRPLGKVAKFKSILNGYNRGYDFSTNQIEIVKELTQEELLSIVEKEKCKFVFLVQMLLPPKEFLVQNKNRIRGEVCNVIMRRTDLSMADKIELLPKSWKKRVRHHHHISES